VTRKIPGSGCRRPKTRVFGTFEPLQGCISQVAVTWQQMTWTHVTPFDRKSPGGVCWMLKTSIISTFELLKGSWKWCHFTGSYLEVAVEGRTHFSYVWAPTGL